MLDADFADDLHSTYLPNNIPKVLLQTPWQENDPMLGGNVIFTHTLTKPILETTLQSLTLAVGTKTCQLEEKPL